MSSYWAVVATDGTITSSGATSDAFPGVPLGATLVTKEQFETIQASPGQCRMVNGVLHLIALPAPTPPSLDAFKAAALISIDIAAEQVRLTFLTPGSGQALEYQETQADALSALSQDPSATLTAADYPWLAAEQDALHQVGQEVTLRQVAQAVKTQMDAWSTVGAAIKFQRRAAKLRIDAASNFGEVQAALDGVKWPSV